eukprot:TRINITY_DN67927_c3_g3_i1.p1 TRINITY_DN67927_c3_g3~~TRINITY_DN67927_c3_g3_i1.p1  ORF type:complete len:555 (+),score=78.87 TRINITY_DN67927_c3_g3_i1:47-1711(+)
MSPQRPTSADVSREMLEVIKSFSSLEDTSVQDIYKEMCKRLEIRVNPKVLTILSPVAADFDVMDEINVSKNYIGPRGALALLPVLAVCSKLVSLNLQGNSLDDDTGLKLVRVLAAHNSKLTELNLSHNDVGFATGKALLTLTKRNVQLRQIDLEHTLIVDPLRTKIYREARKNSEERSAMTPSTQLFGPRPLKTTTTATTATTSANTVPTSSSSYEEGGGEGGGGGGAGSLTSLLALTQKPQDPTSGITFADLDLLDDYSPTTQLPSQWVYDCILEFANLLFKHRYHLRDVFSLFAVDGFGRTTPQEFVRALQILGATALFTASTTAAPPGGDGSDSTYENQNNTGGGGGGGSDGLAAGGTTTTTDTSSSGTFANSSNTTNNSNNDSSWIIDRAITLADALAANRDGFIHVREIIHKLRVHVWLQPTTSTVPLTSLNMNLQTLLDAIYDMRNVLAQAFEAIDPDCTGTINSDDVMEGLSALVVEGPLGVLDTKTKQQAIVDLFNVMQWHNTIGRVAFFDAFVMTDDPERHPWYTISKDLHNMEKHLGTNGRRNE